jgi:alkyl sulfatase BDS1-like metallo-beta-lactamase superfamily hydrolase
MMQQTTLAAQIRAGKAELSGSALVLAKFGSTLVDFDPLFEMMPGTR